METQSFQGQGCLFKSHFQRDVLERTKYNSGWPMAGQAGSWGKKKRNFSRMAKIMIGYCSALKSIVLGYMILMTLSHSAFELFYSYL